MTAWLVLALMASQLVSGANAAAGNGGTTVAAGGGLGSTAEAGGAPDITGITWHPRAGSAAQPLLGVTVGVVAPGGLAWGRLDLGSVWHEVKTSAAIPALAPGAHDVPVSFTPPGDVARPWEVIGVTLKGTDGQITTYGFCELANRLETRERPPANPRLHAHCLDGPGWVVYTIRAEEEGASGMLWAQGVATRDATYVGTGHVLQDASGAVARWGTGASVVYPQRRDGTYVSAGGVTVIDDPAPDPSAQPGTHRVVVGVGGSSGPLEPGATYRWASYYAVRPGHSDLPFLSLEGSGMSVLAVESGTSAAVAWGRDFAPSVSIQRSTPDTSVIADGETRRSFESSATCMFVYLRWEQTSVGFGRIEGPSAPTVGGVVVAGQPGEYRFSAVAAAGRSSENYVVGCADLPLTPQAP